MAFLKIFIWLSPVVTEKLQVAALMMHAGWSMFALSLMTKTY